MGIAAPVAVLVGIRHVLLDEAHLMRDVRIWLDPQREQDVQAREADERGQGEEPGEGQGDEDAGGHGASRADAVTLPSSARGPGP